MPSPKHKCAHPECNAMISPQSIHCKKHVPRTPGWLQKQSTVQTGKKLTESTKLKLSIAKTKGPNVPKTCMWCNKEFSIKPHLAKRGDGKYCSSACAYSARSGENSPFWNGGKKEFVCKQCGKVYLKRPCNVTGVNNFCSYSCNSIYKKSKQKNKNTKIEKLMAQALAINGFIYTEQAVLCNITIADFFIPSLNMAIFCDGNYWHNYPHGKPKDKTQTEILVNNGFNVLRFWGSEIENDVQSCVDKIKSFPQQVRTNNITELNGEPSGQLRLPIGE